MGIILVIEDDEPRIDRLVAVLSGQDRSGVAAKAPLRLEQDHMSVFGQMIGRPHARNAAADDRNTFCG